MDRPDIPLNALRVFEVAMRQGSFTRAAIELRVTQAAVSHQVARLEDLLGTRLFLRTSAGLVPTDEGQALFPVLEQGFDAMARALERISGRHNIEVLKLGVVTTFAVGWLVPRLAAFRRACPMIDLRLSTHNNRVEIAREGLDMAIRFGAGRWPGLEALPLARTPFAPLCAPGTGARLRQPAELAREVLLRSYRADEWPRWFARAGVACPPLTGPVFDSSIALAELAAEGAGVAILPVAMFSRALAEGRLVRPFGTEIDAGGYYLTWPSERARSRAMAEFAAWLLSALEADADMAAAGPGRAAGP
ncbi:LysR family transcriptional regulator [Oceanicella sp. SM1341]|uniref:LysR family transcriptional regulator n=1 Tax=Oceanicella sp. SM1341 TaxID=1548889 RepID=UPI000E4BD281|nr:LysR family transcriptional regulator [Oceanicella sp. SM1341]